MLIWTRCGVATMRIFSAVSFTGLTRCSPYPTDVKIVLVLGCRRVELIRRGKHAVRARGEIDRGLELDHADVMQVERASVNCGWACHAFASTVFGPANG